MNRLRKRFDDDRGSTLPLVIFYGALSLVLVLLVIAATSLYLERKRLFTLADGAALVGAEAFDLSQVSMVRAVGKGSGSDEIALDLESPDVASAVTEYIAASPSNHFDGLRVTRAETVDGRSATVGLSAQWRPPVLTLLVPDGLRIEVTAVARSVFE